jgi:hypothetical protein
MINYSHPILQYLGFAVAIAAVITVYLFWGVRGTLLFVLAWFLLGLAVTHWLNKGTEETV